MLLYIGLKGEGGGCRWRKENFYTLFFDWFSHSWLGPFSHIGLRSPSTCLPTSRLSPTPPTHPMHILLSRRLFWRNVYLWTRHGPSVSFIRPVRANGARRSRNNNRLITTDDDDGGRRYIVRGSYFEWLFDRCCCLFTSPCYKTATTSLHSSFWVTPFSLSGFSKRAVEHFSFYLLLYWEVDKSAGEEGRKLEYNK